MMAATLPDAGYSATPLAAKLGLKDGQSVVFVNLPDNLGGLATARDFAATTLTDWAALGAAGERHDIVHAFTGKRADLETHVDGPRTRRSPPTSPRARSGRSRPGPRASCANSASIAGTRTTARTRAVDTYDGENPSIDISSTSTIAARWFSTR
jgi:hypothetical protein